MHKVILLTKVRTLFLIRSLGPFPIHVLIPVFARLKDSLPPISNMFTEKFTALFSKVYLAGGGGYKVYVCLKTVEKSIWCVFNLPFYFREICSRVGSIPE